MATLAPNAAIVPGPNDYAADQSFFIKLAIVIAAITLTGFVLNAALGRVDIPTLPVWIHLHAVVMVSWLALFITQNRLAASGNLKLHRRLGWAGAFLVCAIVGLTSFTGVMAVVLHTQPPFFSPPYFLALIQIEAVAFAGMVYAAIVNRRDTQTHRRLMFGATIILSDPGISRILPMPLLGPWGPWLSMTVQLCFVAAMAVHDRKTLGRVHPATFSAGLVVVLGHVLVTLAAQSGPVIALAARIGG